MLFRSDRKSTRLNSSHLVISYAVFCLKKKEKKSHKLAHATCAQSCVRLSHVCVTTHTSHLSCPSHEYCAYARTCVSCLFFFFLKKRAPPNFSPFPHPALFPT